MNVGTSPAASVRALRPTRRHGTPDDNLLVHGDNLAALNALQKSFAGKIRCVYLDPPFNTGRSFAQYNDSLGTEEWAAMMNEAFALRPYPAK